MPNPLIGNGIILYIWPAKWSLPSMDPLCLAALLHLQHAIPGKFSIVECNNPDLAPSGQLPCIVHEQHTISTLTLITKYIAGLKNIENASHVNLDACLDLKEQSQVVAWRAHIESNMGDLVYHMLYSHHGNWAGLTHPTLVSVFPLPQRYYVPGRIRETYKPRLEAASLWNLPDVQSGEKKSFRQPSEQEETPKNTHIFLQAFEREKVLEKARTSLDIYARLLDDKELFYTNQLTTLDIILAAHVTLLINPPYPDPFLQNLVIDFYPTLTSHARRVYAQAFSSSASTIRTLPARSFSWRSLVPWPHIRGRKQTERSEEDVHYDKMRWGFFGLAFGSLAAYLVVVGSNRIKIVSTKREGTALDVLEDEEEG